MELHRSTESELTAVEGPPGQPLLTRVADVILLIEACWAQHANAALLYAPNLTPQFFDLSSGEAGEILQKLQNYHLRLAVVCAPGTVTLSQHFQALLAEAQHGSTFGVFADRPAALAWPRRRRAPVREADAQRYRHRRPEGAQRGGVA